MTLSAKVLWPLFPLLLLIVVVCLTWAVVYVVRRSGGATAVWLQGGALACYLLAAVTAMASERGALSANIHRPFSLLTQLAIALAVVQIGGRGDPPLVFISRAACVERGRSPWPP